MKKTIFTTAILFSLLSCSKDENTGGGGSNPNNPCPIDYVRWWNRTHEKRASDVARQNELRSYVTYPYRHDKTKITQSAKDSILIIDKRIDSLNKQFSKDSAHIWSEKIRTGC